MQGIGTNVNVAQSDLAPALGSSEITSNVKVEPLKDSQHNALQIIESMEQGVLVWSVDGRCTMFNERIFDVLELSPGDLQVGMKRREFLEMCASRGEFDAQVIEETERKFQREASFPSIVCFPQAVLS